MWNQDPRLAGGGQPLQDRAGAEDMETGPGPAGQVQGPKVWDQDPVLLDFDFVFLADPMQFTLNMIRFTTELMYLA